jgi:hypothetical protein
MGHHSGRHRGSPGRARPTKRPVTSRGPVSSERLPS